MTTFPGSPKLLNGGIVLIHSATAQVQRIISLQYIPESLSRSLQVQSASEGGEHSEALRQMDRKYNGVFNLSTGSRTSWSF